MTARAKVVSNGELIITNFIDGEVDNYCIVAPFVVQISDTISVQPLSIASLTGDQMNKLSRITVTLSSSSVVN